MRLDSRARGYLRDTVGAPPPLRKHSALNRRANLSLLSESPVEERARITQPRFR